MSVNLLADFFAVRKNKIPAELEPRFSDETLCRKCGTCCNGSIHYQGKLVIIPELPCRFLAPQPDGKVLCKVYDKRQKLARWCQKVSKTSIAKGCFPTTARMLRASQTTTGK